MRSARDAEAEGYGHAVALELVEGRGYVLGGEGVGGGLGVVDDDAECECALMRPGMTVLPVQSTTVAPLGVLLEAGLTLSMRPLLKVMSTCARAGEHGAVDEGCVVQNNGLLLGRCREMGGDL